MVRALEESYRDLSDGTGVCRPRIDLNLPVDDTRVYRWGTMEGGSSRTGYVAIRMKSDVLTGTGPPDPRTQEKYCVRPGLFYGLVLLLDASTGEPRRPVCRCRAGRSTRSVHWSGPCPRPRSESRWAHGAVAGGAGDTASGHDPSPPRGVKRHGPRRRPLARAGRLCCVLCPYLPLNDVRYALFIAFQV